MIAKSSAVQTRAVSPYSATQMPVISVVVGGGGGGMF